MSSSFPPPHDPARDADHPLARAFRSLASPQGALSPDQSPLLLEAQFSPHQYRDREMITAGA